MTVNNNISEEFQYDISYNAGGTNFDLTDVAYDVSFNSVPFILKVDNQNPYRRETAQYKKDQFDNSREPGEQSLTGWWVRSQTSWHNGAGIEFYEPGTDFEYTSNRFHDSRGVDIWTTGELRLHLDVFHGYTGAQGINAATGNDGTKDVIVSGDANGVLKKISLGVTAPNGPMDTATYIASGITGATTPMGHTGATYPFTSVTTSGGKYYATCSGAIHRGDVGTLASDVVFARHDGGNNNAFVKYAKGFVFFGEDNILNLLDTTQGDTNAHNGALPSGKQYDSRTHIDPTFVWRDVTAGPTSIYACGDAGNNSEIWKIGFDAAPIAANNSTLLPDLSSSTMNVSLPDDEIVKSMYYYLGYLAVGTTKGIRICPVSIDGDITLGPLVIESAYAVNGFTSRGTYLYAATKAADSTGNINGILIRVDLSQQFSDGTFAHAYDLEYQSTPDSSDCTEVYNLNDRLVMVIEEGGASGELQVEHTTDYRSSGYLQTGKIRYGTVEPKFFKYLQTRGLIATGDSIAVQTIDHAGNEYEIITLDSVSLGENVELSQPVGGQEFIAIKYTLNNGSPITDYPVLQSYQLKSIPGVPRQRIYQYPLSCYDIEMDKYNVQFGYKDRAYDVVQTLEDLEVTGDFVTVKDYRTEESFQGVIEEVRFTNESSPDKDSNGYGGLLLVTVRKL
jgi:hypothetical protein